MQKWHERILLIIVGVSVCRPPFSQATAKTLAQQEEQLKKMDCISALQETNRMLKMDREKLEQELQQAQAKVRSRSCASRFDMCLPFIVSCEQF